MEIHPRRFLSLAWNLQAWVSVSCFRAIASCTLGISSSSKLVFCRDHQADITDMIIIRHHIWACLNQLPIDLAETSSPITHTLNYSISIFNVLCLNPSKSRVVPESQPTRNTERSENFKYFYLCSLFREINGRERMYTAFVCANAQVSYPALLKEL